MIDSQKAVYTQSIQLDVFEDKYTFMKPLLLQSIPQTYASSPKILVQFFIVWYLTLLSYI